MVDESSEFMDSTVIYLGFVHVVLLLRCGLLHPKLLCSLCIAFFMVEFKFLHHCGHWVETSAVEMELTQIMCLINFEKLFFK